MKEVPKKIGYTFLVKKEGWVFGINSLLLWKKHRKPIQPLTSLPPTEKKNKKFYALPHILWAFWKLFKEDLNTLYVLFELFN